MFKRILVASDLTEQSKTALTMAKRLSVETGANVIAIHVLEMAVALRPLAGNEFRTDLANYRALLERQVEAARERLEGCAERAGLDVEDIRCIVRAGAPAIVIAAVADELSADLIIVGRGSEGRLGPVAEHTVRLVGRTVMVAPVHRKPRAKRGLPSSTRRGGRARA